ncbi:MAG: copper homeostasis protein CutC [Candidatus Omnitrophota bacterium]
MNKSYYGRRRGSSRAHIRSSSITIEVCANSVESAQAAQRGGAHRVELCSGIAEGGITPSAGVIEWARKRLAIDLYVLIRPRGGDFCYSEMEFEILKRDIAIAKQLGADGVVIGILEKDGHVDKERCREAIHLARPLKVTFHRAFDMAADPFQALEDIIELKCDRLLTSGQENSAVEGADMISQLAQQAKGRLSIMAGSGVNEDNIEELYQKTRIKEFHVSGRQRIDSAMTHRNPKIAMGGHPALSEYEILMTDENRIRRVVEAASHFEDAEIGHSPK